MKISKEIAERLNYMKSDHRYSNDSILEQHSEGWSLSENQCLNELSLLQLAECLLLGYEVEETKEDVLLHYYKNVVDYNEESKNEYSRAYLNGYQQGVKRVLSIYNIKIEGINA